MQYRQITHESVAAAKAYLIRLYLCCAFPLFQNKYWYINYDHYVWQAEIIFYVQVQSDCLIKQTHIQRNSKALHLGPVFWNRDKWQVLWNGLSTRCMHSPTKCSYLIVHQNHALEQPMFGPIQTMTYWCWSPNFSGGKI